MTDIGLAEIVSVILAILGLLVPGILGYFLKAMRYAKEGGELLTAVGLAFEDKKLTSEEITKILKEARDLKDLEWKSEAVTYKLKMARSLKS